MKFAYSWGETKEHTVLLGTIYNLCQEEPLIPISRQSLIDTDPFRELTHQEIAEAAGRKADVWLRQDLAHLRAARLIEGEFEGEDDRWAGPLTVRLTVWGMDEVERPSYSTDAERSVLIEIVRALQPPKAWWPRTANYPHAEIEAMDEDQRARLEEIRSSLELLISRDEVTRQLMALRGLFAEVRSSVGDGDATMTYWVTQVTTTGAPKTKWVRTLEEANIDPRILGSDSDAEHADAPGSA